MKIYYFILTLFFCSISFAQTTISGSVNDDKGQPVPGANIKIVGDSAGTVSDGDGKFSLKTSKKPPFKVEVSSIGFATQSLDVSSSGQTLNVVLNSENTQLDEIVISASRAPERVRESPVTIERMTPKDIKKTASPTFYDGLENLKEVHMNTSSMSFKSINTRGFATVANTRFLQLVDGMDNSSPLLNFVLGNLIGVSEIDVQSVELLPGASSALYGANAFNGILFMNSQSPFTKQGISAYVKYGQTSQKAAGNRDYADYGVRVAKAFTPHIAAKGNFTYMRGTDWYATDYQDLANPGADRSFYNYNGVNVYGDEVSTNLNGVADGLLAAGAITPAQFAVFNNILPNYNVSRTGYNEVDLTDNKVANAKIDFSVHLKPWATASKDWAKEIEFIWQSKFGFGNTVYQGANRYYLNDFFMEQHKLELKGNNFFLRGYTTTENGGNSYDMLFTGININRQWKSDATWFGQYAGAYVQSTLAGQTPEQAHVTARNVADTGRLIPGTDAFNSAFKTVTSNPDVLSGSKLVDESRIYHSDGNYNFKNLIKFAEIQVGGSYRLYELNSFGRIYTDKDSQINYTDYGAYTQVQKKLMEDRLKLTGSIRYDKSKNFDGNYSPRISAVYSAGAKKQHNFRGSFQTGFRNPTTQDQYIGFNVGNAVLLGSAPDNLIRYSEDLPVSANGQAFSGSPTVTMNGNNAYFNSYTAASATAFGAAVAAAGPTNQAQLFAAIEAAAPLLVKTNVDYVKPETVRAIELGYRGDLKGFNIDLNGYYNTYNDFIGNLTVVAPYYGTASQGGSFAAPNAAFQSAFALTQNDRRAYQLYTNTNVEIKSLGFGVGVSRKVYKNFELSANYNYAEFDFDQAKDPSFEAGFNTPKHRVKASLGNEKLFKNFGFNVSGRWNSEYLYQSSFADGMISEATVIDAQINYSIPALKSIIKLGASNLGGKEYRQILGAGAIGSQYFASLTINP
ncbi:TonB-dependent receptor domain-containing protein [Flavobacterium sp.]|uniref:TonB-dependent receptor domain-containing protein n=1 Tax=Flavobacterium sp. TaxID=239 RepID=UPI002B4B296B|nr:TonB-dependent receptor [Flavobacterium sp.]HLP64231.1 TonB-dependent receptor [Flavobacterium sp.]